MRTSIVAATILTLVAGGIACEPGDDAPRLPSPEQVDSLYRAGGSTPVSTDLNGNVVEVVFRQDDDQLRRGGSLWARVGPYIYLATPPTREIFETYGDVAGVRVITTVDDGTEVARAMLPRNEMTTPRWAEGAALLGRALQEGTRRPRRLQDLAQWGERYAVYRYNQQFLR